MHSQWPGLTPEVMLAKKWMNTGVNHFRVFMSQPADRHDKPPVPQRLLASLLPLGLATTGLFPYGILKQLCVCVFVLRAISGRTTNLVRTTLWGPKDWSSYDKT